MMLGSKNVRQKAVILHVLDGARREVNFWNNRLRANWN